MTERGFTLVELLIVIAILALIASIMIPSLINARKSANNSSAQSLTRNMASALESYRAANGTIYTDITDCAPIIIPTLSNNASACQFKQDQNASYILVKTINSKYFYFDGEKVNGPIDSIPLTWQ